MGYVVPSVRMPWGKSAANTSPCSRPMAAPVGLGRGRERSPGPPRNTPQKIQTQIPPNRTRCSPQCWMQLPYPPHIKMGSTPPCSPSRSYAPQELDASLSPQRVRCQPTDLLPTRNALDAPHAPPGPDAAQVWVPPRSGAGPPGLTIDKDRHEVPSRHGQGGGQGQHPELRGTQHMGMGTAGCGVGLGTQ